MISVTDLHWIAGFIEGDGFFHAQKTGGSVTVAANQVQRWPLEKLQKSLGGTLTIRKSKNPNWNDQWAWRTGGSRAVGIIFTIYSLLSPRRQEQARKVLAQWKSKGIAYGHRRACYNGHIYVSGSFTMKRISEDKTYRRCKICYNVSQARWLKRKHTADPSYRIKLNALQRGYYRARKQGDNGYISTVN